MRTLAEVWKEFLELQIKQFQAAVELATSTAYFNNASPREFIQAEEEMGEARRQFDVNQKRLAELKDELLAVMAVAEPTGLAAGEEEGTRLGHTSPGDGIQRPGGMHLGYTSPT